MDENCFLPNLTIVTHGKWTKWSSWGDCQFVTFPRELNFSFYFLFLFLRLHWEKIPRARLF